MATNLMLFTRDLRLHDLPALSAAGRGEATVVPVFVFDEELLRRPFAAPNRARFLLDCLADLDDSLRRRGSALITRRGRFVEEVVRLASTTKANAIFMSRDVSAYARKRAGRLQAACRESGIELRLFPGITAVEAGQLTPGTGDHFKVFSPYHRRWRTMPLRPLAPAPREVRSPSGIPTPSLPRLADLVTGTPSPDLARGGETEGRKRLAAWTRGHLHEYEDRHDDLAGDVTSRISPYLHFGCLSPAEIVHRLAGRDGGEPFLRQLCWRDFHHQVLAAFPRLPRDDYRSRGDRWRQDAELFEAWKQGRTGYPIVDAGMRQLRREGWMHNRARLITASFLVKDLYVDWRLGAGHFMDLLVDGDVANNYGNWQWVAGTGNDTRPNRIFNPIRQAERFDPQGDYVRRYLPELSTLKGKAVHQPRLAEPLLRRGLDYPEPIVDHGEAAERFRKQRAR